MPCKIKIVCTYILSRGVPCFVRPVISRPVKSRGFSFILVLCSPVKYSSRPIFPVESRDGSIPSCTVPCFKYPFFVLPGQSQDISTPRNPVPRPKFGPEEKSPVFFVSQNIRSKPFCFLHSLAISIIHAVGRPKINSRPENVRISPLIPGQSSTYLQSKKKNSRPRRHWSIVRQDSPETF